VTPSAFKIYSNTTQ